MKKFKLFLMMIVLMSGDLYALMGVTNVEIKGKKASVVLDGYLKISDIDVIRKGDRIRIKPPIYVSKAGKIFPQVKFLNNGLKKNIEKAIKTGKVTGKPSDKMSFKVTKMSEFDSKSSMKFFAAVSFNNEIEVECKVNDGRKGLYVGWPSKKAESGKWVKTVQIIRPEIRKKVEKSIIKKAEKESSYKADIVPGGKTLPLMVTDVDVIPVKGAGSTKAIASIMLNNAIRINEIEVKERAGKTRLKFPVYSSGRGKIYPQIKILDPALEKKIVKAIEAKSVSGDKSNKISYKISKYSPFTRGNSSLKVFCAVTFNGKIEIECKIMDKTRGPWVTWPARKPDGGGSWIEQVELKDKKLKSAVEKSLIKRYELASE